MARVVITEFMDEAAVALLAGESPLYDAQLVDKADALRASLADCEALIVRNRTRVNADLLATAPKLRVVGRLGVGLENVDLAACKARGVVVLPATGANDESVAEYVMVTALMMMRGVGLQLSAEVVAGKWPRPKAIDGRDIVGRTLGLVGFGAIARQVARRAAPFGIRLLAHDPFVAADDPAWKALGVERRELDAMLPETDILSVHVPLTNGTRGLLGAKRLATLPAGACVINTARGSVIDYAALAAELRSGRLGGAALDVFEQEPLPANSGFDGVPNLLLTPHVAGVTRDSNQRVSQLTAENVLRFLRGEKPTVPDAAASA